MSKKIIVNSAKKKTSKKVAKKSVKKATKKTAKKVAKKPDNKPTNVAYTLSQNTITVSFPIQKDGGTAFSTHTFDKGTNEYTAIKQAVVDGRFDEIPKLAAATQLVIAEYASKIKESFIKVDGNSVSIDGVPVPPELCERILTYAREGLPYMDLVNFFRNLQKNPSYRAVNGLFRFLDKNHFPLTSEGCFIGYKGVANDFKDLHTHTMDNSPGKVVSLPRNRCDEDPDVACSSGLHVAGYNYAHNHYGSGDNIVIEVKVNPKDVVAVPFGDNDEKMRVCEYLVLGVSAGERREIRYEDPVDDIDDEDDYEDEEEEELDSDPAW